jgi:hypothetical protein
MSPSRPPPSSSHPSSSSSPTPSPVSASQTQTQAQAQSLDTDSVYQAFVRKWCFAGGPSPGPTSSHAGTAASSSSSGAGAGGHGLTPPVTRVVRPLPSTTTTTPSLGTSPPTISDRHLSVYHGLAGRVTARA